MCWAEAGAQTPSLGTSSCSTEARGGPGTGAAAPPWGCPGLRSPEPLALATGGAQPEGGTPGPWECFRSHLIGDTETGPRGSGYQGGLKPPGSEKTFIYSPTLPSYSEAPPGDHQPGCSSPSRDEATALQPQGWLGLPRGPSVSMTVPGSWLTSLCDCTT